MKRYKVSYNSKQVFGVYTRIVEFPGGLPSDREVKDAINAQLIKDGAVNGDGKQVRVNRLVFIVDMDLP